MTESTGIDGKLLILCVINIRDNRFIFFVYWLVSAVPVPEARPLSAHEQEMFREILCIFKGETPEDCLTGKPHLTIL